MRNRDWSIEAVTTTVEDSSATLRDGVAVTLRRLADADFYSVVALADCLSDAER